MEIEHCEFPDDLLYALDTNVWIRLDAKEVATLGITSVHAALAGKLKEVKFKSTGTLLERGRSVATIESVKYFGAVRTPITGTLVEVNSTLERNAKLANDHPYDEGWFVRIQPSQLDQELQTLTQPRTGEEKIRSQISDLRVRCFKAFPDHEMWEIGVECAAVLVRLNELMNQVAISEVVHIISDDQTADIEMVRPDRPRGLGVEVGRKAHALHSEKGQMKKKERCSRVSGFLDRITDHVTPFSP